MTVRTHPCVGRVTELPRLEPRPLDGHKGNFGRLLILGGSRGMSGAACLAGVAGLRSGAGLVRVATPLGIWPVVAAFEPSYLTMALAETESGCIAAAAADAVAGIAETTDGVVVGPGLGAGAADFVRVVIPALAKPLIIDADGLNSLVGNLDLLSGARRPIVLTPHPGEFARLTGLTATQIAQHREQHAIEFAARHGVIMLLKGRGTVVTDGCRTFVNATGNAGMATGGTGDVLSGLLGGFVVQGIDAFDAAVLAAHVHGLAGDLAARDLGQSALIASDLPRYLPAAIRSVEAQ